MDETVVRREMVVTMEPRSVGGGRLRPSAGEMHPLTRWSLGETRATVVNGRYCRVPGERNDSVRGVAALSRKSGQAHPKERARRRSVIDPVRTVSSSAAESSQTVMFP
jgi:hypothetical protein